MGISTIHRKIIKKIMNMENNNYIKFSEVVEYIRYGLDNDMTTVETTAHFGKCRNFFSDYIRRGGRSSLDKGSITQEQYSELIGLYEKLKNNTTYNTKNENSSPINSFYDTVQPDADNREPGSVKISLDEDGEDDDVYGIAVRDENKRITHYEYSIKDRHQEIVKGVITRELMSDIFRLYTQESGNLTQRIVARELLNKLNVDFFCFQKLLKVFKITKASIPVAFHILEEEHVDDILEKNFREKEKIFFKRLEQNKCKKLEERNLNLAEENKNLKEYIKNTQNFLSKVSFSNIIPFKVNTNLYQSNKTLCLFISDVHLGALVDQNESLYENDYTIKEVERRFTKIVEHVIEMSQSFNGLDRVVMFNMGDMLDGDKNQTTRGGHFLPQYLSGKQQFNCGVALMQKFVEELYRQKVANHIDYHSVSTDNHAGILGYTMSRLLTEYFKVKYPGMIATTSEKFIDWVKYGEHIIMYSHGKDDIYLQKHYPMVINNDFESKINEFIDFHLPDISRNANIIFVKGDLHTSATTYAKKFKYRSVGSVFGSSLYCQMNFGNATPCCEYTIINQNDKNMQHDGRIILV
jgi:hypothetical protein